VSFVFKNKFFVFLVALQPGAVFVTKGHSLPTRYIIHTVCPNYNQQNRVASIWSENTLQLCYRNVLNKTKELGLHTIGLCTLSVPQRNFPTDIGAHIALSKSKFLILSQNFLINFF
jgi:O-acetyl-ADP-ribose deacetylase (regulator of RNase III)